MLRDYTGFGRRLTMGGCAKGHISRGWLIFKQVHALLKKEFSMYPGVAVLMDSSICTSLI
jgi:hypothetical protein